MVGEIDDKAIVKVIDFGVAKALNQKLTENTIYTQFAAILGTPLYMSPEQAGLGVLDIDTRSNVYSLGVLLYQMLTGTTPFDREKLDSASFDEVRRIIREDEPSRPSALVATIEPETRSTVSEKRGIDPRKFTQIFRGEIDWIVMKSLEKDRKRRYQSASELSDDIERYLDGDTVEACPPSIAYRISKSFRKNQVAIITVALVGAAMLVGTAASLWQAKIATDQRQFAQEQQALADANFEKSLEAVDTMLRRVADKTLATTPQLTEVRLELFDEAIQFYDDLANDRKGDDRLLFDRASTQLKAAWLDTNQKDHVSSLERRTKAKATLATLLERNPADDKVRRELAANHSLTAHIQLETGGNPIPDHQKALELLGPDEGNREWAMALRAYGSALERRGETEDSEAALSEALNALNQLHQGEVPVPLLGIAWGFQSLSKARRALNNRHGALQAADQAVQYAEEGIANEASLGGALNCLSAALYKRALVHEDLEEDDQAINDLDAVLEICRRAHREFPAFGDTYIDQKSAELLAITMIRRERRPELEQRVQQSQPQNHAEFRSIRVYRG